MSLTLTRRAGVPAVMVQHLAQASGEDTVNKRFQLVFRTSVGFTALSVIVYVAVSWFAPPDSPEHIVDIMGTMKTSFQTGLGAILGLLAAGSSDSKEVE